MNIGFYPCLVRNITRNWSGQTLRARRTDWMRAGRFVPRRISLLRKTRKIIAIFNYNDHVFVVTGGKEAGWTADLWKVWRDMTDDIDMRATPNM